MKYILQSACSPDVETFNVDQPSTTPVRELRSPTRITVSVQKLCGRLLSSRNIKLNKASLTRTMLLLIEICAGSAMFFTAEQVGMHSYCTCRRINYQQEARCMMSVTTGLSLPAESINTGGRVGAPELRGDTSPSWTRHD